MVVWVESNAQENPNRATTQEDITTIFADGYMLMMIDFYNPITNQSLEVILTVQYIYIYESKCNGVYNSSSEDCQRDVAKLDLSHLIFPLPAKMFS